MKNKISVIAAFVMSVSLPSMAQDVHFSQMEYSPMTLNPALTGANSPMQAIVNYRSQWNSVAEPFNTIAASFDARFNDKKRDKKGIFAGGINFYNDQAGDNLISTNKANLNLAYHLILDRKNTLGLGIYGGWGQRTLDYSNGKWASQYDGVTYNATASSGENFNAQSFSFIDAGAGMVYTYRMNEGYMTQNLQRDINAGVAFFHVNSPSYSFIENDSEKLYMRWSIFANAVIGIPNSRGAVLPGVYFNRQKSAMEILYGLYYRYTLTEGSQITGFNKPFYLHLGLFHRWGDAVIPKISLEWHVLTAGFAYDVNISSLNRASNAMGGFEVFLRYNMPGGNKGGSKSMIR